jgi:cation diffusion facilitator CzcD-associated flavoprotein CzcO
MGNPKICIVGGGFAGMCAAIRLKTKLGLDNFTIYDENNEFGGTWLLHSFPKCACDIAAHLYSFSFEPNPSKYKGKF